MDKRITDHLTESDRTFLHDIKFTPQIRIPPGPLEPGWDCSDAEQLLAELGLKMFHQDHGGS